MSEISILFPSVLGLALSVWCGLMVQSWTNGIYTMSFMRLNFLADPTRATEEFCHPGRRDGCILNIKVHGSDRNGASNWRDLCPFSSAISWSVPRRVVMEMRCQSKLGFATVEFDGPRFEFLTTF